MPQFPWIPSWSALHPLVVHFPIVLLFLSPLFVLLGAILSPAKGRPYMIAALIVLLLGTGSLFVSTQTGEAAARLVSRGDGIDAVLTEHQRLASESEIVFSGLSVILLVMVVLPTVLRREETRLTSTFLPLAFLVLYSAGILTVVRTAHAGGRLVHEFGIHAIIPAESGQSSASPAYHFAQRAEGKSLHARQQ